MVKMSKLNKLPQPIYIVMKKGKIDQIRTPFPGIDVELNKKFEVLGVEIVDYDKLYVNGKRIRVDRKGNRGYTKVNGIAGKR